MAFGGIDSRLRAFMDRPVRGAVLLLFAVGISLLTLEPSMVQTFSPLSRGLTVIRDKDFANYDARLERALSGYPQEAANGITPVGSGIEGMQTAGMEQVTAMLFSWTGLPAPPLSIIITSLCAPILFLLLFLLFRTIAFPDRWALLMTLTLFITMFHVLTRVMHPGWSFVPTVAALIACFLFWESPTILTALLAGLLLGAMPSIYFWSWTWVWAACGSFALLKLLTHGKKSTILPVRTAWPGGRHPFLIILLAITIVTTASFNFLYTYLLFSDPLYPEVAVRASFLYQRTPESWPRTVLLVLQTITFLSLWPKHRKEAGYLACAALLMGITIAMHQNVLHNRVLMFSSHFYPHLLISTVAAGAWVWVHKTSLWSRVVIGGIAAVFVLAGVYDYIDGHLYFLPRTPYFRQQHLLEPVALLQNGHRDTVLSDYDTGRLVTAWTDDGIIYTTHTRFLFLSDSDIAERFCVSEMFNPEMPVSKYAIYNEYNAVLDSPRMRARENQLVTEACTRVRADPKAFLRKYGVTHVLWNEKDYPAWQVPAKELGFSERASGTGWVLWEVPKYRS